VRIVLAGMMAAMLAVVAGRAFDHVVWSLLAGPVLTTGAALVVRRRPLMLRAIAAGVAVVVATITAGVWANASVTELLTGVVTGPRRLLTTEWPSPLDPRVVIAVALLVAAVSAVTVELAGRPGLHVAPLAAVATGLAATISLAAPVRPERWTLVVLGATGAVMLLARHGDDARRRLRTLFGERSLPVMLVLVAVVGVATSRAAAWDDRADPRRATDPEITLALLDPIEETVALRGVDPPVALFSITDRSRLIGQSLPARWRLAALDTYDGQRWVPTVTVRPIGDRLGQPAPSRADVTPPIEFDLELLTDDFDLIPIPGRPLSVEPSDATGLQTDSERTVVRLDHTPRPGLMVHAEAEVAPTLAAARSATLATRTVDDIALGFDDTAQALAGDGDPLDQVLRLERAMHDDWQLDSNAAGAGQQQALIERFVTETRRGTAEQFVTAFVLMARALGFDARVAGGFVVPPDELKAPLTLSSSHAAVWPEVRLDELGWLAFDPVPAEETGELEQPEPPASEQSPSAAQPPIAPPTDRATDDTEAGADAQQASRGWGSARTWLVRVGAGAAVTVLPLLLVASTITLVKLRRRRRRLRDPDPARRVLGAWANVTDTLIDAGLTVQQAWTDERIAEHALTIAPSIPAELQRVASGATAVAFGPADTARWIADEVVAAAAAVDPAIRAERTRWQRLRWRMSLRSLRRPTRSPIAV
jgi:transglutaminase-like putative cysteine protease